MLIIAEIGQAHEGSLGIAHSYIDALADTGIDAIKFQTHIAEAESSPFEPFRVKFSYEDKTRMDYWKRMEFTPEQWAGLKQHCEDKNLEFISSPFSNTAVDLLERIGVNKYKIGSGEINNFLLLQKVAITGKEIILSSGMSSFSELDDVLDFLNPYGNKLSVLQCTTAYPTMPEQWGLNIIAEFKEKYNLPVGFSDHSGNIFACLAATALGAEILEFHVTFDKKMFGPDASSSLTIDEIKTLTKGVKQILTAQSSPLDKSSNKHLTPLKTIFEKTLAVNKNLAAGHIISLEDLEGKKPKNFGIDAKEYAYPIGKRINRDITKWEFLSKNDLDE